MFWVLKDLVGLAFGSLLARTSRITMIAIWHAVRVIVIEAIVAFVLEVIAEATRPRYGTAVVMSG